MEPPLPPQLLPQLLLMLLLLLLLLPPLAAVDLRPLPEELLPDRPIRMPVSGNTNVTSFDLNLEPTKNDTLWLSIDIDFVRPSVQPRLHYPLPVALLHNMTNVPPLWDVPRLLTTRFDVPIPSSETISADTLAYEARQLRSGFLSRVGPAQALSVYNVAMLYHRGPFPDGVLTLTLFDDGNRNCAGFFDDDEPCDLNGDCKQSDSSSASCVCRTGFFAPTCTEPVSVFREGGSNDDYDASDFDVEASSLGEQYVVVVQPFQTVYVAFNYSALSMEQGGRYEASVRILRGTTSTEDRDSMLCEVAAPIRPQTNQLPNWRLDSKQFKRVGESSLFEANFTFLARGTGYTVALFANASHTTPEFDGVAVFAITTPQLVTASPPASRQRFLPQAMLPVCLSLIFVAGLAVVLVFWLDRRSGRNKMVDRLSETELSRMYPVYAAERSEGECPICLSDMLRGDSLRALRCEHHFHAECLDPWLCENRANCPTCRAAVRVDHLSDNHREPVCSRNRSCWSCLFCTSRDGDDGAGEHDVREREEQRTRDQEEQQQSLEPQRQLPQDGVRIAFPDRVHWPPQTRTASSTPRTQSTAHAMSETGSEDTSMHTALDLSFDSCRREQRLANVVHRARRDAEG